MPLYDYKCECDWSAQDRRETIEHRIIACPNCLEAIHPTVGAPGHGGSHTFRTGYYPQLTGTDPVYITSKSQLRAEAKKRGKYSEYAE